MQGIEELEAELLSGDEARAEAAAGELAAIGEPASEMLLRLQRSDDRDARWWATRTLAGLKISKTEWFLAALRDEAPEIRAAGALALAAHPDPTAVKALIPLLDDADNVTAVMAVHALVKIGSEAVPDLLEAFDHTPRRGQIQIVRALAELRDHRAIQLLLDAQGRDSAALQYWAQEGLERLGLNMVYLRPD